jgi:hypothetical protein
MKTLTLTAALLLLPLTALAQPAPLLTITDPEGDDVGDGSITYPRSSAFAPGDLDLRMLRVFAEGKDLRFEATLRNPIRNPASVHAPGMGSEDLSVFARRGFYAFNLDIYIDTDRVPGSGNTFTLPGRHAQIDPAHAWEKVVVLTPRPELMRRQLNDALAAVGPAGAGTVGALVDGAVFFATDVRVRGRTVSFVVPGSFLGSTRVNDWSLTAMVTAAKLTIETDLSILPQAGTPLERLSLAAQQPERGRPEATLGYSGDRPPATAIVDLLTPDPQQQAQQLAAGAAITGLSRENGYGAIAPPRPAAPVQAATAAAPPTPPAPPPTLQSLMQPAAPPPAPAPKAAAATAAAAVSPAPATPQAPEPKALPVAPAAAATAAAVSPTPRRDAASYEDVEQRLLTLKRLRERGLISEEEYQGKRREVLGGL